MATGVSVPDNLLGGKVESVGYIKVIPNVVKQIPHSLFNPDVLPDYDDPIFVLASGWSIHEFGYLLRALAQGSPFLVFDDLVLDVLSLFSRFGQDFSLTGAQKRAPG
jgi:hypothetical protein